MATYHLNRRPHPHNPHPSLARSETEEVQFARPPWGRRLMLSPNVVLMLPSYVSARSVLLLYVARYLCPSLLPPLGLAQL